MNIAITKGYNYLIEKNLLISITHNVKGSLKFNLLTVQMFCVTLLGDTDNI